MPEGTGIVLIVFVDDPERGETLVTYIDSGDPSLALDATRAAADVVDSRAGGVEEPRGPSLHTSRDATSSRKATVKKLAKRRMAG